jgi:hypothetical protein
MTSITDTQGNPIQGYVSFASMLHCVHNTYSSRSLQHMMHALQLAVPSTIIDMFWNGESAEYIVQAGLVIQQIGE